MKHRYRRFAAAAVALGVFVSSFALQQPDDLEAAAKAKVSSVKVTNVKKKKLTLNAGKTFTLKTKVKVKPNKAKFKKVTFQSSNKKIASVNKKGKIKALKKGNAKITVASKVNKKKKIKITVKVKEAQGNTGGGTQGTSPQNVTSVPTNTPGVSNPTGTPVSKPTPTPTVTPVPTQKPDGTSTLMRRPFAEQAFVGDKLSDVAVKSGQVLDSNGNEIKGSYVWEEPQTVLSAKGKTRCSVKFVPESKEYAVVEHIKIPVLTIKNRVIITPPTARSVTTGSTLSAAVLFGGSAKDENGAEVPGSFDWADRSLRITKAQTKSYAAVFTPQDTNKYRTAMVYVSVKSTGADIPEDQQNKKLDLKGDTLKNPDPFLAQWGGKIYDLTPYLEGLDMSQYTKLTVEAKSYDSAGRLLTDSSQGYIGYKLANRDGDWAGFSDAYVNSKATLSLGGYEGGSLYLVTQNMQDQVAYIEVTSIVLETGSLTNVDDGTSMKLAFEDIFGKVGNILVAFQINNSDCMRFLKAHYNSMTMGNEMKPDYLLGGTPTLSNSNPDGYADTSKFTSPYKDSQYPVINLDSIDRYMEMAYNNGIKMRYHVFVWHNQTPKWFFKKNFDENEAWVSPEVMNGRLEYYVRNVMTHIFNYKNEQGVYIGREVMDNWDMANEYTHNAENDYKSYWDEVYYPGYKFEKDKHSDIYDPEYIKRAFAIGHSILQQYELENKISLVYNDYNTYEESDHIVSMINYFNSRDEINPDAEIICDGVGTQMHLDNTYPRVEAIGTNTIDKFTEAGFEIQPTEMDITDKVNNESTQKKQMANWYNLMLLLMDKKEKGSKITGVVWWGLADDSSWRRENIPLLFQTNWQAKQHYFNVMDAVSWYNQGDTTPQRY